jgi:hypothetical protein
MIKNINIRIFSNIRFQDYKKRMTHFKLPESKKNKKVRVRFKKVHTLKYIHQSAEKLSR